MEISLDRKTNCLKRHTDKEFFAMSIDDQKHEEISDYIEKSKFAILTYVREDLAPVSRTMGSFAPDGLDLFFSTRKDAAKVAEITRNRQVSFFFEHDGQSPSEWRSVLLIGDSGVAEGEELKKAVALLSARNPRFRERAAKGELADTLIFKINTKEVEFLDRSKGHGFVQKVDLRTIRKEHVPV
jgi:nitroimidazol reductase NimA-like FMN-containing flavoprotein (pyridoxamine 5'-phosphate oxidase superfamily)